MCVILVCPPKVRPAAATLYACHAANPHGAGVAWRENGKVRWLKNLGPGKLMMKFKELPPGEVVVHFRWASVGGSGWRSPGETRIQPRGRWRILTPVFVGMLVSRCCKACVIWCWRSERNVSTASGLSRA